jgi:hypothetical protein
MPASEPTQDPRIPSGEELAKIAAGFLERFKLPISIVLAVLFAGLLNLKDYGKTTNRELIETQGVSVPGKIFEGTDVTGRRSRQSFLVSYQTADQRWINREFEVTGHFFRDRIDDEFVTNPDVEVRYLPSDPYNAIIIGGMLKMPYWVLSLLDIFIGLLIGGIFFYLATIFVGHWMTEWKGAGSDSEG